MKELIYLDDKTMIAKFFLKDKEEFNKTLAIIRELPKRSWKPKESRWEVSLDINSVSILKEAGFKVDDKIMASLAKEAEIIAEKQEALKNIKLKNTILYDWQQPHAIRLIASVIENNGALDGSDTGTGKTYSTLQVAKHLKLTPIIITKKRAIPAWEVACGKFGIKDFYVNNYEQYKFLKTPFLVEHTEEEKSEGKKTVKKKKLVWKTTSKHILIWDEAHCVKNHKTINAEMFQASLKTSSKILAASATIGDNPLHLYSLGLALGLFHDWQSYWRWMMTRGVAKNYFGVEFNNSPENLLKIHQDLFPKRGSRISIADLGDKFPENLIIADPLDMGADAKKIQQVYEEMDSEIGRLKERKEKDVTSVLTQMLRARQEIELLKIPTMVSLAEDIVEEGASVAIFINFKESLSALSERLKTKCIIDGSTKYEDCLKNMNDFQEGKERIILCNIRSGGVAINLHNEKDNFRRESIISPTPSAQDLIQTLGRIHRAGSKTHCIQRIIYAKGTVEEEVAERMSTKVNNIRSINDGELATAFELKAFLKDEE